MREVQRWVILISSFVDTKYILLSLEWMQMVKMILAKIYSVIYYYFNRLSVVMTAGISTQNTKKISKMFCPSFARLSLLQTQLFSSWVILQQKSFPEFVLVRTVPCSSYLACWFMQFSPKKSISLTEPARFRSAVTKDAALWMKS